MVKTFEPMEREVGNVTLFRAKTEWNTRLGDGGAAAVAFPADLWCRLTTNDDMRSTITPQLF